MQETYQAVIVEDDPMIASIDQNFLERDPRFRLAASFRSGQDALPWLLRHPADLLILDVYMPRMTGLELLRELRSFGITSDAVMVTAANDSKTVDALLKLGVADYLVKPFTARRFQQALDKFCRQRSAIATHSSVSQEELDALLSGSSSPEDVPKGLQSRTLERIRTHLAQAPEEGCTCESLAAQAGLSSVTVGTSPTSPSRARWSAGSTMTPAAAPPSSITCPTAAPEGGPRLCLSDSSPADLAGSFFFYFQCGNFPRFDLKFCWASTCIFPQHPV